MNTINGKTIWIIGASSGIGAALAEELSNKGAKLILSARSENKLKDLNKKLGGHHTTAPLDVGDEKAVSAAAKKFDRLDSVIFMAAIYAPHSHKPKELSFIHDMLRVNIGGAYNTVDAVRDIFTKQGYGQIVLCGSVAGYRGLPYGQPYCSTKAAIINLGESLKIELEDSNIDVKIISPGFVKTPLTDKNDFDMPMIIEPEEAAKSLVKGLQSGAFEIHFPKKFTYIMKIIDVLPRWIYFPLARIMKKKQS